MLSRRASSSSNRRGSQDRYMEHVRPTQLFVSEEPSPPPAPPPRPTPADRKAKFEQAQDKLQRARSVAAAREFARGRAIVLLQRRARSYLHLTRERRSAAATTVQQQARRMIATKVTQRTPTTTARSSRTCPTAASCADQPPACFATPLVGRWPSSRAARAATNTAWSLSYGPSGR